MTELHPYIFEQLLYIQQAELEQRSRLAWMWYWRRDK
ncbi:hypothetical protein FHS16_005263 [Paenibacillus endophyticus]|uniref:Uncharacterized protein n=1 Tax=Paenibacillus endophyticus TaxID=1294268 RepID=A0A7W5GCS3_9BACL|nr:hypothetical protein [Paenibacillus endophyticus]